MYKEMNDKARELINKGKTLVDIRVESENSEFKIVKIDSKYWFLRFMSRDCYACVSLDECERFPVSTVYKTGKERYSLLSSENFNGLLINVNKYANRSDSIEYLVKYYRILSDRYCAVYDNLHERVVCIIDKKCNETRYIIYDCDELVAIISNILKEYNITTTRTVKMYSKNNSSDIFIGNNFGEINISGSKYSDELYNILDNMKDNIFNCEIECIIFRPSILLDRKVSVYAKESKLEPGKTRIILSNEV